MAYNEYKRMFGYIKPHMSVFVVALIFVIIATVVGNAASIGMVIPLVDRILGSGGIIVSERAPVFLQGFIDRINGIPRLTLLNYLALWLLLFSVVREVCRYYQTYMISDLGMRVVRDVRTNLYAKFMRLSLDYYSSNPTGKLVSRIMFDTSQINNAISQTLADLVLNVAQLLINLAMVIFVTVAFGISWKLLVVTMVLLPLVVYPISKISKKLRKISVKTQDTAADINISLIETISGIRIVKAFSMEDYEIGRFKDISNQFYKLSMQSIKRITALSPITELMGMACALIAIWFGVREVINGAYSAGGFVAFLTALLLLVKPFNRISRIPPQLQQALAASNRIHEILNTIPGVQDKPDAPVLPVIKNKISLEDVHFSYEDKPVLKDVSLEAKVGDVLAIVGPSGAGKTTLINLIPRFYDVSKGAIKIDGVDIRDVKIDSLLGQIGVVTQETILFNDTVRANIAYGHIDKMSDKKIIEAAKAANAHDFIKGMPGGYDTLIGERGFKLSGGEKQRLAIARAILKNPPILILDEATSQLDTESERLVQGAIDRLMGGRTVFVIAHRLSTIRHATQIAVIDDGTIAERGTHDELMKKGGTYKRLYDMQFAVAKH